jgi:hypothetical protein
MKLETRYRSMIRQTLRFSLLFLALIYSVSQLHAQSWQAIAPMAYPRAEHRAVTLNNGKILVAGGRDNQRALSSCEIYDPLLNIWTPTGDLNQARYRTEMIKLQDGRVLITGGLTDLTVATTNSCEIYDPSTGTWRFTTNMSDARENHFSVLLPDGKVVLLGGLDANQPRYLSSFDLFDPLTETMQQLPPMLIPQFAASVFYSTVLNGLFVEGGSFGGFSGTWITTTQVFSFADSSWRYGASSIEPHDNHYAESIQLPDESVIALSGRTASTTFTTGVEQYNPVTKIWNSLGKVDQFHWQGYSIYLQSDSIIEMGGEVSTSNSNALRLRSTSIFNLKSNSGTPGPPMISGRSGFHAILWTSVPPEGVCVQKRIIYVFGGAFGNDSVLSASEKLDLGIAGVPPNILVNVKSLEIGDSSSCLEVDTSLSISNLSCDSITLLGIKSLDSAIGVTFASPLPAGISSGGQNPFSVHIIAIGQDTSLTSALQLTFLTFAGDTVHRFIKVNVNLKVRPNKLEGPSSLKMSASICSGLDTTVTFRNSGCGTILFTGASVQGSDSKYYSISTIGDTILSPGGSLRLHLTGTFIQSSNSTVDVKVKYILYGRSYTSTMSVTTAVASGGSSVKAILLQAPPSAYLGDTIEVPLYILVNNPLSVNGMTLDLKYNTDLLHLIACVTAGTSTASVIPIVGEEFNHTLVRISQSFTVSPSLQLIILKFKSFVTSTSCSNLVVDQLTFDQGTNNLCNTTGRVDSVQICFLPHCGDPELQGFMSGKLANFTFSPNPANGYVEIQSTELVDGLFVQFINMLGEFKEQIYISKLVPGTQYRISTEDLPAGDYILALYQKGRVVSKRITILR